MSSAKLMLEYLCIIARQPITRVVSFVHPMLLLQMCTVSWAVLSGGQCESQVDPEILSLLRQECSFGQCFNLHGAYVS